MDENDFSVFDLDKNLVSDYLFLLMFYLKRKIINLPVRTFLNEFIYNHIKINEEKLKVGVYCPAFYCDPLYIEYNKKFLIILELMLTMLHLGQDMGKY